MPRLHPKARSPIPAHAPAPAAHAHAAARIPPEHGPGAAREPPQPPGAAQLHGGLLRVAPRRRSPAGAVRDPREARAAPCGHGEGRGSSKLRLIHHVLI